MLSIAEFPVPSANAEVDGITAGPDGNLWFTEGGVGQIGTINPTTHAIAEYPTPIVAYLNAISTGPDGNIWFGGGPLAMTNPTTHAINDIPYTGSVTGITSGPDGNLWFTDFDFSKVNMVDLATDAITQFPTPDQVAGPGGITVGPDGNLWFTDEGSNTIDEISPMTHAISEFPLPTAGASPASITVGLDGNLWFTESGGADWKNPSSVSQIGVINPTTHAITEFPTPTASSHPTGITTGPDGNIWFTEQGVPLGNGQLGSGQIGEINPTTHAISEFSIPYTHANPVQITRGPDDNLWFTDIWNNAIGVVTLNTDHFVVTQQPPSTVTAGATFGLTVEAEDSSGNLLSSFSGPVTVALGTNPGSDTLGGTLTATASHGVATFSGLTITKAASGYTLEVSSSGVNGATTNPVTVTPAAPSQLAITQQPPASVIVGHAFGLQATIEDAYGNVETTDKATVTVALATSPGGATLGGATSATASQGVASFSGLTLNKTGTGYTIAVASNGLTGATTDPITVNPVPATKLVVIQQPPASVTAGGPFTVIVQAEDDIGEDASTFNGTVTLALGNGPPGAALGGTLTVTASNGAATFSSLTLTQAASGYTLVSSSSGLNGATTNPFTIIPAAPSQLVITQQPPANVVRRIGFGLQAAIEDVYGNVETGDSASVTVALASNPGGATLGGTTSVTAGQGVASFSGLTLDQLGTGYTLAISSAGLTGATTAAITVLPLPITTLVIAQQPPASVTAGDPFGLIVQAEDSAGDLASTFDGTVTIALASNPGGDTLGGTLTVTAANGVATFAGLTLTRAASGYSLKAYSSGLTPSTTGAIAVTPAAAAQVAIAQQPPASIIAGSPFGLRATIEDAYGNVETNDSGPVSLAMAGDPTRATLGGPTSATADQGVATFSGLRLTVAASGYTLQVSRDGLAAATTAAITVTPAAPAALVPAAVPSVLTAGAPLGLTIDVEDAYGNLSALPGGVSIAIASGPGGAVLSGPTSATAPAGVATFTGLTLTRAGAYTLQATGGGLPPVTIGPIAVTPAAASQLLVTAPPPGTVAAGAGFGLTVSAEDPFGNPTPTFGAVTITGKAASGGGPLGGTTTVSPSGGVATFAGLVLDRVGTYSLQVTSPGLVLAAPGTVAVTSAAASQLVLTSQPPASVTAGAGFGLQVEAQDPYGNKATGFGGLLTAALAPNAGNAMLGGTITATADQGLAAFAGLAVDKAGSGYTIQVSGDGLGGATTDAFGVTPAAASGLAIAVQPPAQVTAGQPFDLSVGAVDPYGNALTSFGGAVQIALGAGPGGLNGTAIATASGGVAAFSRLTLDAAGSGYTITATSAGLTAATTAPISVVPAAAAKLVVTIPPPTTMTAGAGFGLAIAAQDAYGNLATGFAGVVTLALANDPTGATISGPVSMTAAHGVANFPPSLMLDTAGSGYTIQASRAGLVPVTTGAITVVPGAATHLVVLTQPPSSPASGGFGLVVAAEDAYGNIDPHFAGPVSIAPVSGSGATLAGPATITASQGVASFHGLALSSGTSTPVSLQVTGDSLTGTTTTPVNPSVPKAGGGPVSPSPTGTGTGTGGGPTATPVVPLAMTGVRVVTNKRRRVTEILIGFNQTPDPAEAASIAEYQLIEAGRHGSFTGRGVRPVALRSAFPDPTSHTVALIPRKPFGLKKPVGLAVDFVRGPLFVVRGRSVHRV